MTNVIFIVRAILNFALMQIAHMLPQHAEALEELQQIVFPTLAPNELLRAEQYRRHLQIFPEGQFVLTTVSERQAPPGVPGMRTERQDPAGEDLSGMGRMPTGTELLIGMTTTMRTDFDFTNYHHTFSQTSGGGWLTNHQPEGKWLYGLDMGIHPAYRGRGGARLLYRARQQVVRQLGLAGQLTVGVMSGYGAVSGHLSGEDYYRKWKAGNCWDPTLSPQRKIGFHPLGLIPGYLHDPGCGNYGVLLRLDATREV